MGYQKPSLDNSEIEVKINPDSDRLQLLKPFQKWGGKDLLDLKILIKTKGKCTTDHISMAGPWLKFRGHLENISKNLLLGATNAFNDTINLTKNQITGDYNEIPMVANHYRKSNINSIVIGDENYGEGSSREHAAMEPRFMGVSAVLVKSFARIHETNLKKQGILALTFKDKSDYDLILEDDAIDIIELNKFNPNNYVKIKIIHPNNTSDTIFACHTYNHNQIKWFKAGSSLNVISKNNE